GKRPTKFSDFVVVNTAAFDVAAGKTVHLLYNKNNEAMCTTTVPIDQTLTCEPGATSPGISNRKAVYTMSNGMITAVITDVATV
ncbi:MAG: hypothetical protein ACK5OU_09515, partial [Dolichospermum sp.]